MRPLIVHRECECRPHVLFVMVEFAWSVEVLRRWEFLDMNLYGIVKGAVVAEVEEGVELPLPLVVEVAACQLNVDCKHDDSLHMLLVVVEFA